MIERVEETRAVVALEIAWYLVALTGGWKRNVPRSDLLYTVDGHRDAGTGTARDVDEQIGIIHVHDLVVTNFLKMHLSGDAPLPDSERLRILLSDLTNWGQRLAGQAPSAPAR